MGIFDGCLITSDVDDTLVSNGFIHPRNIEKIEFFIKEGGMFSVATGRSANAISTVTNALKRFSPSVVANGCLIYDFENKKVLYQEIIPKSDHKLVKAVMDAKLNVGCEVHSGYNSYTIIRNSEADFHQEYESFVAPDTSFEDADLLDWNKVVFLSEDVAEFEKIKNIAKELNVSANIVSSGMFSGEVRHDFLEIVPKGISKASAINKLCEIFGIDNSKTFAIGDFYNDVAMLENAAIAAATAGAPDDIKAISDYISGPCEEGAVADFIEYLTVIYKTN